MECQIDGPRGEKSRPHRLWKTKRNDGKKNILRASPAHSLMWRRKPVTRKSTDTHLEAHFLFSPRVCVCPCLYLANGRVRVRRAERKPHSVPSQCTTRLRLSQDREVAGRLIFYDPITVYSMGAPLPSSSSCSYNNNNNKTKEELD